MAFNACPNKQCQYDWSTNPLGITLELDAQRLPAKLDLRCALCGEPLGDEAQLSHLDAVILPSVGRGVTARQRIVRWTGKPTPGISILNVEEVSLDDVLFEAIPVFTDGTENGLTWPTLPVRPEYLALVDLKACRAKLDRGELIGAVDFQRGVYLASIPFLGRGEAETTVERPIVGRFGRRTNLPRQEAIPGAQLTVWPKVRSDRWRSFIVDAEALNHEALGLPSVRVYCSGATRPENADDVGGGWFELKALGNVGYGAATGPRAQRIAGLFQGTRPEAVAMTYGARHGGVFLPAGALASIGDPNPLAIGIDFGTSNSCVAFKAADGVGFVEPPGDNYEVLIRRRQLGDRIPSDEYAPRFASKLFGPTGDIFPTELLTRDPASSLFANAGATGRLRPGLDYVISGDDVQWEDGATQGFLTTGFKWSSEGITNSLGSAQRPGLIATYLKALLVQSLAARIERLERVGDPIPGALTVSFGYPGMWSTNDINGLKDALQEALGQSKNGQSTVAWGLTEWLQLSQLTVADEQREAFAAARVALGGGATGGQTAGPRYRGTLLVDIGGGSTDIAFVWMPSAKADHPIIEYMSSLRYAGEDLFKALLGPPAEQQHRCFAATRGSDALARSLRASGPTPDLFNPMKSGALGLRVRAFFGQLTEYLARLVAATVPSGSFARRNEAHKAFPITMIRLGNGWGLSRLINPNIDTYVETELERRIRALLASSAETGVAASVKCAGVAGLQPKHAVALGLLHDGGVIAQSDHVAARELETTAGVNDLVPAAGTGASPWVSREVMGLDVLVNDQASDQHGKIDWWREVTDLGLHIPIVHGPIAVRTTCLIDWLPMDTNAGFVPPFGADVVAGDPRAFLQAAASADPQVRQVLATISGWPTTSPLGRLLETGLLTRLARLG